MFRIFMDEPFRENAVRAQLNTYKIRFSITLVALIILCHGRLFGRLEYTLIATIIALLALGIFLPEYRQLKNLTQEQLAAQVGVRRKTIMRLKKAQYNPSLKLGLV